MTTSRRQFLGGALSVAALAGLPVAPPLRAQPAAGALITRPIPASGEQLPVIGAGTSGSFEATPGTEKWNQLKQVLEVFFDAGARLIDTSPNYSGADTALGALLAEGAGASVASWPPRSPPTAARPPRRSGRNRCGACVPTGSSCCRCTTCATGSTSCPMRAN